MAVDPPVDNKPIALKPATFNRHEAAAKYVEGLYKTRVQRPDRGRGPYVKPGAWGLLVDGETITAIAGLVLGTGTVTLCTQDGTALTATSATVDVVNSGDAITAAGGDKVVRLAWTEGAWAVNCWKAT